MSTAVEKLGGQTPRGEKNLVTQLDYARAGQITPEMRAVAEAERRDPEFIRAGVAAGRIAIPANIRHLEKGLVPRGVGAGLFTKVNVNLGISGDVADAGMEWEKVRTAEKYGADAIMDLSNSGKTRFFRQQLVERTPLMVGTVPMYDAIPCTTPLATWRSRSWSSPLRTFSPRCAPTRRTAWTSSPSTVASTAA